MTGRAIPDPGFAGDGGAAAPAAGRGAGVVRRGARQRTSTRSPPCAAPGCSCRWSRVLGEVEVDEAGLAHDKTSDMATVLLQGADGRMALLAFTGTEPCALGPRRPTGPVTARTAAQAALQDGAAALVVDVAGPATLVVEAEDLRGPGRRLDPGPGRGPRRLDRRRRRGASRNRQGVRRLVPLASDRSGPPAHG